VTARWRETDRDRDGASCALTVLFLLMFPAIYLLVHVGTWVVA
jgi:hypothetical protein